MEIHEELLSSFVDLSNLKNTHSIHAYTPRPILKNAIQQPVVLRLIQEKTGQKNLNSKSKQNNLLPLPKLKKENDFIYDLKTVHELKNFPRRPSCNFVLRSKLFSDTSNFEKKDIKLQAGENKSPSKSLNLQENRFEDSLKKIQTERETAAEPTFYLDKRRNAQKSNSDNDLSSSPLSSSHSIKFRESCCSTASGFANIQTLQQRLFENSKSRNVSVYVPRSSRSQKAPGFSIKDLKEQLSFTDENNLDESSEVLSLKYNFTQNTADDKNSFLKKKLLVKKKKGNFKKEKNFKSNVIPKEKKKNLEMVTQIELTSSVLRRYRENNEKRKSHNRNKVNASKFRFLIGNFMEYEDLDKKYNIEKNENKIKQKVKIFSPINLGKTRQIQGPYLLHHSRQASRQTSAVSRSHSRCVTSEKIESILNLDEELHQFSCEKKITGCCSCYIDFSSQILGFEIRDFSRSNFSQQDFDSKYKQNSETENADLSHRNILQGGKHSESTFFESITKDEIETKQVNGNDKVKKEVLEILEGWREVDANSTTFCSNDSLYSPSRPQTQQSKTISFQTI
ncbi:hypothetical protein HK099_002931 [Clydaea vesicula]|uniref:Uncharacterized protein n=1 Tax=Clydaea vesicula TaxID=447962 RepID=A0AAD5UB30_9FUNG|nr:hypothetical protein HK099_002931 [Clydaea vesicula]